MVMLRDNYVVRSPVLFYTDRPKTLSCAGLFPLVDHPLAVILGLIDDQLVVHTLRPATPAFPQQGGTPYIASGRHGFDFGVFLFLAFT